MGQYLKVKRQRLSMDVRSKVLKSKNTQTQSKLFIPHVRLLQKITLIQKHSAITY
jgi:hypothetical protein